MAIKDWNSRKAIYHGFYYKKKGETIYVVVEKIDNVSVDGYSSVYEVSVGDGEFFDGKFINYPNEEVRIFKKLTQALKFAKAYKRKN
jgi:hypothetical protein